MLRCLKGREALYISTLCVKVHWRVAALKNWYFIGLVAYYIFQVGGKVDFQEINLEILSLTGTINDFLLYLVYFILVSMWVKLSVWPPLLQAVLILSVDGSTNSSVCVFSSHNFREKCLLKWYLKPLSYSLSIVYWHWIMKVERRYWWHIKCKFFVFHYGNQRKHWKLSWNIFTLFEYMLWQLLFKNCVRFY
jgi:hypothetical protein